MYESRDSYNDFFDWIEEMRNLLNSAEEEVNSRIDSAEKRGTYQQDNGETLFRSHDAFAVNLAVSEAVDEIKSAADVSFGE